VALGKKSVNVFFLLTSNVFLNKRRSQFIYVAVIREVEIVGEFH
jgi:hypothetical protein